MCAARTAVLDGEIVALDEHGRSSFSLMQQRTGFREPGRRGARNPSIPILYYAFDLLYLDGYSLFKVDLEKRKELLAGIVTTGDNLRYSDHYVGRGTELYRAAAEKGLEGIVAKRRRSCYLEKRSREWLKMKITQRQECVIGGYTDPKGSREHFGSVILGLYDDKGRLIHVGQAGSGFTHATHADMWRRLEELKSNRSPFYGRVQTGRGMHWVKPELVAEIKFTEWTHENEGGGLKMRAPVYEGLRFDKKPRECVFVEPRSAVKEAKKGRIWRRRLTGLLSSPHARRRYSRNARAGRGSTARSQSKAGQPDHGGAGGAGGDGGTSRATHPHRAGDRAAKASDQWSYYQAKGVRRHNYEAFAELLAALTSKDQTKEDQAREKFLKQADRYRDEQKEIEAEARKLEQEVLMAGRKANRFNLGEVFLEIALVVTSITLLTSNRAYWAMGIIFAAIGIVVAATGFLIH